MKRRIVKMLALGAGAILALALLGGCFRQHIQSAPAGATPAVRAGSAPAETAPAPASSTGVGEPPAAIEETYVVDAPQPEEPAGAAASAVKEADLGDEPAPASAPAKEAARPAETAQSAGTGSAAPAAPAAAPEAAPVSDLMGEMFYVQVGSYSELENANKVLSALMGQGYDGSKLSMTDDGRFRVQAGAFTDREAARRALEKLIGAYKGAFILKETPQ
ncbi:MAG: SPOR domain-containing protein [Pseudodesulfovibrio sp.]